MESDSNNWNEQKERLRQKLIKLTGNEMWFEECGTEEIMQKLQDRFGKTKEELTNLISKMQK